MASGAISLINTDAGRLPLGSQLVHLSDRYLLYVFTCLGLARPWLTDNELAAVFGTHSEPVITLEADWLPRFLKRVRESHARLKHAGMSFTGHTTEQDTAEGIRETTDSLGRILEIRCFGHLVPRALPLPWSDPRFGETRDSLALFPTVVFRFGRDTGGAEVQACLLVCSEADEHETTGDAWPEWGVRCAVLPSPSRSTKLVGPARLVATDGVSLYRMISSWRTNACLVFSASCGVDIVNTVCALAIGDKYLGRKFRLKCVTAAGMGSVDLRSLEPMVSEGHAGRCESLEDPLSPPPPPRARDTSAVTLALCELRLLPAAFTVVVNNGLVCALRHTLRDLLVIVPRGLARLVARGRQSPRKLSRGPGLYGQLIEWVPSNRSAFRVHLGSSPDLSISSRGEGSLGGGMPHGGAGEPRPGVLVAHRRGVLTPTGRSRDYDLSQAACLAPGEMRLSVPQRLHFAGCIAMLYAFELLALIYKVNEGRARLCLSLSSRLALGEAQALMLAYLAVETGCEPGRRHMAFSTTSRDCLRELRMVFSADPDVCPRCPKPPPLTEEVPMPRELEDQLSEVEYVAGDYGDEEAACLDNITRGVRDSHRLSLWTGHSVLIDQETAFGRKSRPVGVATLGLVNLTILKAAGLLGGRRGKEQIYIHLPATSGIEPVPRWSEKNTELRDEFYDIPMGGRAPSEEGPCFFQLNYQPPPSAGLSACVQLTTEPLSAREAAVVSEEAKGYIDHQLECLFEWCRRWYGQRLILHEDGDGGGGHAEPWLMCPGVERRQRGAAGATIGDGSLFPSVEIAALPMDTQGFTEPLHEYKLNLSVGARPKPFALARADRATSQDGTAYEVHVDEAVMLGHCSRLLASVQPGGGDIGFDVSVCLSAFYRATHPCLLAMAPGDVALDYELVVHGGGSLSPVYALLEHLADTCRVNSFSWTRLVTLTRHRAASAWTRAVPDSRSRECWGGRINLMGAFLCSKDHRLGPLLARCCDPCPLKERELLEDCGNLLPRGDEEELLLRAYEDTLGPVLQFEPVVNAPSSVRTSIGTWRFLRLIARRAGATRRPGISVVDGYTFVHAAESPLFYVLGEGPLVQSLESVALVVQSASARRTLVLGNDEFSWPEPTPLPRLLCKHKKVVLEEMFSRPGRRDPVESYGICGSSAWRSLVEANWTFGRAPAGRDRHSPSWDVELPVSRDLLTLGFGHGSATCWCADRPPAKFTPGPLPESCAIVLELGASRASEPQAWRGFDILASRVLVCGLERRWSRGTCMVVNRALGSSCANVPTSNSNRITIVAAGEWYAKLESELTPNSGADDDRDSFLCEVYSASGLARALAARMLSGNVYEHLEIRCLRSGVYGYVQRMLVWFAGATGPFRSRTVTVYSDEGSMVPWAHKLHSSLDVLRGSRTKYLVSCHNRCKRGGALDLEIKRSEDILPVNSYGNLVLHHTKESVRLAEIEGETGFHAVVVDWLSGDASRGADRAVHIRCSGTLKRFCGEAGVPIGIRGPETWDRAPWSSHDPGGFCSRVARLKYRWESGWDAPDLRSVCSASGSWSLDPRGPPSWNRPSDGRLIAEDLRFWELVDVHASTRLFTEREDIADRRLAVPDGGEGERGNLDVGLSRVAPGLIPVKSEWRDSNAGSGCLVLNSRLVVEFVTRLPGAATGCVLVERGAENSEPQPVHVGDSGRVTGFYRAGKFSSLMRRVAAVSLYGCGLRPALELSVNMDRPLLYLAAKSLALAEQISPCVSLGPDPRLVLVVRGGRQAALETAREMLRGELVTTLHGTRYLFEPLPGGLHARSSGETEPAVCPARAFPERFGSRRGHEMFDMLKNNWPALLLRGDIKSPCGSSDPRWIGLLLCLCEWHGIRDAVEQLVPGALEWTSMTTAKHQARIAGPN